MIIYLLSMHANIEKDFEWMKQAMQGDVTITNKSDEYASIALQGPLSEKILQTVNYERFNGN